MKTNILNTLALIVLTTCFAKTYAQSDLFAMNTIATPASVAALYQSNEKVAISDFTLAAQVNTPQIAVKSTDNVSMQVRIFSLSGELAKEETHDLASGVNNVTVNMNDLAQGVYMVQFYTKDGSALRRFVKNN
jgi:hypothetical protein